MEALLKEEDQVVLGRKAARAALEDAKTAVFRVRVCTPAMYLHTSHAHQS